MTAALAAGSDLDLRHFAHLGDAELAGVLRRPPTPFGRDADRATLAAGLGATLYSPATRPDLVNDLVRARAQGVVSTVLCLEDSIGDDEVAGALDQVVATLEAVHDRLAEVPLVFVRVRDAAQIGEIAARLGVRSDALSGFVLPKFAAAGGRRALAEVAAASATIGRRLWAMPVIETPEVAHRETRIAALREVAFVLAEAREHVLAVRIGATDLAGVYGLRRPKELTVYDLRVVADAITDILNVLGRTDDDAGWVVTGAVWEYFAGAERIFKPQLRETPFGQRERELRARLITSELDGLIQIGRAHV